MNSSDIYKIARKLAKTTNYQSLFSLAKEIKIGLFENDRDFSELQIYFLYFLSFYSSINLDIAIGDVHSLVLEDTIYEDAYMYYKNNKKEKKISSKENSSTPTTQWIFKKKKI